MVHKSLKNMLIGLFVFAGVFLIIGIVLFIKPSIGDGKQILNVRFNNIGGIQVGTRVTLAGKPIGEVEEIHQIPNARQHAVNHFGQVFPFVLTLKIDSSTRVFSTDQFTVQTQGLLGEKYIAILPQPQKPGQVSVVLNSKDIIYADSTDLFESAVNEFKGLSEKMENTLEKVIQWMDKYGDNLGTTVTNFGNLAGGLSETVTQINKDDLVGSIKNLITNITSVASGVDVALNKLHEDDFFDSLSGATSNINVLMKGLVSGKGTIGKLLTDDGFYLDVSAIFSKANMMMNDINQYGLLFQYSKAWQRQRVKLMAAANSIKDPKAFGAQMNHDVDFLLATLERMNILTDRFSGDEIACNASFQKKFLEFMNMLKSLQERVTLYNQELYDQKDKGCQKTKCKRCKAKKEYANE
jgi:phospholipid/cholesterol/gamma-HCH transport system substrate-binding protein